LGHHVGSLYYFAIFVLKMFIPIIILFC